MKKILLLLAVIASVSLVACNGNKSEETSATEASTEASAETSASAESSISPEDFQTQLDEAIQSKDAAKIQQLVGESQTTYNKLAATDKAAADAYLKKVQEALNAKANEVKTVTGTEVSSLISKIVETPENVANAAKAAGDSVTKAAVEAAEATGKEALNKAKEQTVDKATEAVKKAKEQTIDKANKAVDKANKAVDNAQKKANDAVSKGKQKAAEGAAKAVGKLLGN